MPRFPLFSGTESTVARLAGADASFETPPLPWRARRTEATLPERS